MANLQVEYRPIASLIPYARNSRTHDAAQVAQIAASIREFGWTNPILVDEDGGIIAGHGRVMAARQLGQDEVPTIELAGLSETQRRAYVIADNKLALNAGWDDAALRVELEELAEAGFDLDLTGFSADEIAELKNEDDDETGGAGDAPRPSLADRFMVPPFSVLNAREGWWQQRKRAWLALGIRSELGRGGGAATPPHPPTVTQNADGTLNYGGTAGQDARFDRQRGSPGGSPRPAADYSKRQRGNGAGRPING